MVIKHASRKDIAALTAVETACFPPAEAATAPEITEEMYEQLDYLEKHPEENYYENEENFSQYDQGD